MLGIIWELFGCNFTTTLQTKIPTDFDYIMQNGSAQDQEYGQEIPVLHGIQSEIQG